MNNGARSGFQSHFQAFYLIYPISMSFIIRNIIYKKFSYYIWSLVAKNLVTEYNFLDILLLFIYIFLALIFMTWMVWLIWVKQYKSNANKNIFNFRFLVNLLRDYPSLKPFLKLIFLGTLTFIIKQGLKYVFCLDLNQYIEYMFSFVLARILLDSIKRAFSIDTISFMDSRKPEDIIRDDYVPAVNGPENPKAYMAFSNGDADNIDIMNSAVARIKHWPDKRLDLEIEALTTKIKGLPANINGNRYYDKGPRFSLNQLALFSLMIRPNTTSPPWSDELHKEVQSDYFYRRTPFVNPIKFDAHMHQKGGMYKHYINRVTSWRLRTFDPRRG